MAELIPKERLQPALLDRLIDTEPDKKQEPRESRLITKKRLHEAVMRDRRAHRIARRFPK